MCSSSSRSLPARGRWGLALLLPLLLVAASVRAQPTRFETERLTLADGLPDDRIHTLLEDRYGFLWVGSANGLARYDGYGFTTYRPDPTDSLSLSHRSVISLLEDRRGRLWVGTQNGLSRFDRGSETFVHYTHALDDPETLSPYPIFALFEDRQGGLWAFTGEPWSIRGLDRLDPETGVLRRFGPEAGPHGLGAAPSYESLIDAPAIIEDRAGTLWVGTQGRGLYRFDPQADAFLPAPYAASPDGAPGDTISVVIEPSSTPGVLWLGTRGAGLVRYEPATGRARRFRHDPANPASLSSDDILHVHEDRSGRLWIATADLQLHHLEPGTGTFTRYPLDPTASVGPVRALDRMLEDRDGRLWVSTDTGTRTGVDVQQARVYGFDPESGASVRYADGGSLLEDAAGLLWLGSLGFRGLTRIDTRDRRFRSYRHDPGVPNSLPFSGGIQGFYEAPDGMLWGVGLGGVLRVDRQAETVVDPWAGVVGGYEVTGGGDGALWVAGRAEGALFRLTPESGAVRAYRHDPENPNSLGPGGLIEVYVDAAGVLWVGSTEGLSRYDPATDAFTRYLHDPDSPARTGGDPGSLPGSGVSAVLEDRAGALWIYAASRDEPYAYLARLDRQGGQFTAGPPLSRTLNPEPTLSRDGAFWVPSDQGVYRYDPATGAVDPIFTQADGLPDNGVQGILEDDDGRLWISTRNGLSRYDPATGLYLNFDVGDGLPSNRFFGAAYRLSTGEMAFGTSNGFVLFDPASIRETSDPPNVVLTELRLFNERVRPGPESPLRAPIEETEAIRLRHGQNDVTLSFVGLQVRQPEQTRYRYRLEGYEDVWREAGARREAVYPNLPPGDYTFRVAATSADGVESEPASLRVTVLPPWWRTTWAYGLYGLLFIAGVFAVDRVQRRRLVQRERQRAAEREAELERENARRLGAANEALEDSLHRLTQTQDQLIQSEKLASLGALAAGIAHEIKNPLNFVNNFAELNAELVAEVEQALEAGDTAEARALLADLLRNEGVVAQHGKRADAIVQAMMQHASGGTGQREAVELNALVSEYVDLAYHGKQAQTETFDVEVVRNFGADVGAVEVVPQEIGRVLLNLLSNAFDAVAERQRGHRPESADEGPPDDGGTYFPTVTVSTRRVEDQVEIRVSDNGSGMAADIRDRIFEPFFSTKPTGSGTGLGLSLSHDIVQGHGGTLSVESAEGAGATFVVALPGEDSEKSDSPTPFSDSP